MLQWTIAAQHAELPIRLTGTDLRRPAPTSRPSIPVGTYNAYKQNTPVSTPDTLELNAQPPAGTQSSSTARVAMLEPDQALFSSFFFALFLSLPSIPHRAHRPGGAALMQADPHTCIAEIMNRRLSMLGAQPPSIKSIMTNVGYAHRLLNRIKIKNKNKKGTRQARGCDCTCFMDPG